MPDDLGPLPKGDRQDSLQQLSLKALHAAVPEELFLSRDERMDDKGVDGSLEVKIDGGFTNCRGQFQLKSTDSGSTNQDGSVSYPIAASNLNYLSNGPSPLYFLWIAPSNELRFAWAHDERKKLDAANPGWMKQESVTLRFSQVLTRQALGDIHKRILAEARLQRQIHDSLARAAASDRLQVRIDRDTLRVTDPKQAKNLLDAAGMAFIAAGYGKEVLDLARLLEPEDSRNSRIQLICGYANHSLGMHQAALACLAESACMPDTLSGEEVQFLETLRGACDYSLGRLTLREYLQRQEEMANQRKGLAALEHRLESLRYSRLTERSDDRYQTLGNDLRKVAAEILNSGEDAAAAKLQTRIILVADEGEEIARSLIESLGLVRMRQGMKMPVRAGGLTADRMHGVLARIPEWEIRSEEVVKAAKDAVHPLLYGDALLARLGGRVAILVQQRMDAIGNDAGWSVPDDVRLSLMQDAEAAREIHRRAGNREGECRAQLLLADLFEVTGQQGAARKLAEGVVPVARAMGYPRLEERAREHVEGNTLIRRFETLVAQHRQIDEDYEIAAMSDVDAQRLSLSSLESAELPRARLPFVTGFWLSQRRIAQERINWCRHLILHENLVHERSPITHFATDPPRVCLCERYGYQSAIEHPDYDLVINTFKDTFCKTCPERSPKGAVATVKGD